jgi:hypothetical protein
MFLQGQYSLYTSCRPRAFQMQGTENNCSYSIRRSQPLPMPLPLLVPIPVPELGRGRGMGGDGECLEMEKEPDGPELIIGSTRDRRGIKVG